MALTLGWFSTGRGEGSCSLLKVVQQEIAQGALDARIQVVFSNREPGEAEGSDQFFEMVRGYGIPLVTLSSQRFRREHGGGPFSEHRLNFDREAMQKLRDTSPDLCVLAGYMLITGPGFCQAYDMINFHPALPDGPVGTWQQVIWRLIETEAAETGAMVHVATEVVDEGPTISFCRFPIRGGAFDSLWKSVEGMPVERLKAEGGEELPLFQAIRQEGVIRESPLLLETLRALASGRIRVEGGRVLDTKGRPTEGRDLSREIEERLRSART